MRFYFLIPKQGYICLHACVLGRFVVSDCATPWTVARQAPLSVGFSRQEYWSGLPCPPSEHYLSRSWETQADGDLIIAGITFKPVNSCPCRIPESPSQGLSI